MNAPTLEVPEATLAPTVSKSSSRSHRRLRAGGLMLAGVLVYAGAVWWFATSLAEDVRAGIRDVPIDTILYDVES